MITSTAEAGHTLQLLAPTKIRRDGVEYVEGVDKEPLFHSLPRESVAFAFTDEHRKIVFNTIRSRTAELCKRWKCQSLKRKRQESRRVTNIFWRLRRSYVPD